jgi:4-hydroxy-tetrahydrodipicolinate synthase
MAPFGEVLTAMITPFTDTGEVDYDKIWRLARYLVDNGSDGLVVTGTTGESPVLSADEKVAIYRAVVEAVGERATIVAGTGTYNTAESVELSQRAADAGVDAVMAVTPYYSKPDQAGLVRHFSMIADATDLPLLVYNIPGRSARLIEVDTLAKLSAHPNIVAVKDAVMDIDHTAQSRLALPPEFAIYSGQDSYTLAMMVVGAAGVISVASHLVGNQIKRMVRAAHDGDWAEAQRLNFGLLPVFYSCFTEPSPMPVKGALSRLWESVGEPRPPLVPASPATIDAIEVALGKAQSL